jgi:co-chaperonin GroES (HSP10)
MRLKAIGHTIIVEPDFEPTETESGILLKARKVQKAPNTGTVVSIGSFVENVAEGERIVFHTKKNNPQGFKHEDVSYIHVQDDEVYAKL